MKFHVLVVVWLGAAALNSSLTTLHAQGSLTPPGPPSPTMKSLDQIEPRTPLDASHGDGLHKAVILEPGSYYLTTNIVGVGGQVGIYIGTNDVTLDLNGFSVRGVSSSNDGMWIDDNLTNIVVRNGTISGWGGNGIYCGATDVTLEHLNLNANVYGVYCMKSVRITDCTANYNSTEAIHVASDSIVTGCWVKYNTHYGIVGSLCTGTSIVGNHCAGNNTANVASYAGIYLQGSNNRIEGNDVTVAGSNAYGILLFGSSAYTNNIIVKNFVQGGGTRNYGYSLNQMVGPIITNAVNGITITNSSPWANFSY